MIREAIREGMKSKGISLNSLAKAARVDRGNLSRFLRGGDGLGLRPVERVMKILSVEVRSPDPEWLQKVNRLFPIIRERLPDIPQEDIRMILVSLVQPIEWKFFLLKKLSGGGYAF